jgi:hypothetical protein
MKGISSHPIHENRTQYEGSPPQGLSEARRAGSFLNFLVTDPLGLRNYFRKIQYHRGQRFDYDPSMNFHQESPLT